MAIINPKGTANWLIRNTSLTFYQIADFCELHVTEIQAMADNDENLATSNPIYNFQLTLEEIEACQKDESRKLQKRKDPIKELGIVVKDKKVTKYKTLVHRRIIPDVALYMVSVYPKLSDVQIAKLIGSTKTTVEKIRHGTYKGMSGLVAKDPILTGLCSKKSLDTLLSSIKSDE